MSKTQSAKFLQMFHIFAWLPVDNSNRVFILGVLTVAAFAGAYIFWGPNSVGRRKSHKDKIPGLLNLGKSCFVNAVLQGMASSPAIVKWLAILHGKLQPQTAEGSPTLIFALYKILSVLNNQDLNNEGPADYADASEVLKALQRNGWVISNDEQDAHEMFHVLTTTIEEELLKETPSPSLADVAQLDQEEGPAIRGLSKCCSKLPTFKQKESQHGIPYRGLLASRLRCKNCSHKSPIKFDTFDSLSLSIPSSQWTHLTLQDCLRHFMMPEQVQDVECDKCSSRQTTNEDNDVDYVKTKSTSVKQLIIGKLPDVLCIHIQRMTWLNNGVPMKQYQHVAFPEYLKMNGFAYLRGSTAASNGKTPASSLIGGSATPDSQPMSNGNGSVPRAPLASCISKMASKESQKSLTLPLVKVASGGNLYRLQTAIVHLGDIYSGHFVTYRRGAVHSPYAKRWFLCSDTSVQEVPAKDVFKCNAYMLFYERIQADINKLSV